MPGQANMAVIKFQRRMSMPSVSFSLHRTGVSLLQRQTSDDTGGSPMMGGHIVISLLPRDRVQIPSVASLLSSMSTSSSSSPSPSSAAAAAAAVTAADNAGHVSAVMSQTRALPLASCVDARELTDGWWEERCSEPGRVHYVNHVTPGTQREQSSSPAVECPRPQEDVISTGPPPTFTPSLSTQTPPSPTSPCPTSPTTTITTTTTTTCSFTCPLSPPHTDSDSSDSDTITTTSIDSTITTSSDTNNTITTSSNTNNTITTSNNTNNTVNSNTNNTSTVNSNTDNTITTSSNTNNTITTITNSSSITPSSNNNAAITTTSNSITATSSSINTTTSNNTSSSSSTSSSSNNTISSINSSSSINTISSINSSSATSGRHTSTAIHHFVGRQSSPHGNDVTPAQLHDMGELSDADEQYPVNVLHTSREVSTCQDPCNPRQGSVESQKPLHAKLKPDLSQKLKSLRQQIQSLQPHTGFCHLHVSREDVFEDSYRQVMKMHSKDLQKRLMVKFDGEEGLDYGGVAREWFYLLSHEMLNPHYGLFQYSREDLYTLQINPDSGVNPEHLSYFHFVGRVMGMAVFHGHYLDAGLTLALYKQLLGHDITLHDLHSVDPDLHRSLCWMLENSIENVMESSFSVEHYSYGKFHEYELKPGGREIRLTDDNKQDYVKLYVQWRFMRGMEAQFQSLLKGFSEIIPRHLLHGFDEGELQLMVGGLGKIDLDDWKKHTRLRYCSWDSDIVRWFWKALEGFDDQMRARTLQFVTGSSTVPLQGFQAMQGPTGAPGPRLFTIQQVDISTDNLPIAHTCFNRLDIPPYESFEKFLSKLTCAVEETCGFAVE